MARNPKYVAITVQIPREQYEGLKRRYPKYGQIAKLLRFTVGEILNGRFKTSFPATV